MRGAGIVSAVLVAVALGLDAGDLLAKSQTPVVIHSMTVRPDLIHWQVAAWDWLRASVTSTPFLVGTALGVVFAEVGRFVLRWAMRALGFLTGTIQLVIRYRLILASVAATITYTTVHWPLV